jgi:hypothetical protein
LCDKMPFPGADIPPQQLKDITHSCWGVTHPGCKTKTKD